MTSPDKSIEKVISDLELLLALRVWLDFHIEINVGDGFAHMTCHFYKRESLPAEKTDELLPILRRISDSLLKPLSKYVAAFFDFKMYDQPLSRLKMSPYSKSDYWSCDFERYMTAEQMPHGWDSCQVQIQLQLDSLEKFKIHVSPSMPNFDRFGSKVSEIEDLVVIDNCFSSAAGALGQVIGALLNEPNTRVALGKTAPPSDYENPDDGFVISGVVVD